MKTFRLLCESQMDGMDHVLEAANLNTPEVHYLQGPFMMAESPNKNRRIYNLTEMAGEVTRYDRDYIKQSRAVGELDHPVSSTEVTLSNAAHKIVRLERKDNMFYGKTQILSTPMGLIAQTLLKEDVKLGISTRALGKLKAKGDVNVVEGFHLICLDIVHEPSAPAMLEAVMENKKFLIDNGGLIMESAYNDLYERVSAMPRHEREQYIVESFAKFFDKLRTGK